MNSIWNKNIELFQQRFPQLYNILKPDLIEYSLLPSEKQPVAVISAKSGIPTALWNNLSLHSKYDPIKEAQQAARSFDPQSHNAAAFFSFGLGYAPVEFAKAHPDTPLLLIEEDINFFNAALSYVDWESVFLHSEVAFIIQAPLDAACSLLKNFNTKNLFVYSQPSQSAHSREYIDALTQTLKRNLQKDEINTNTLERFAHLWLKNSCKNLRQIHELDGIQKYQGKGKDIPFTVLAAGPSLSRILPHLAEIKKHSIIVCVDTALHACLRQGVQPDFIVLVDPQYACALHLEFLSSPESVLITESAAWPSVFRFNCKEIVLCSSLFPIGQYFESYFGKKGKLGAGGSVTTTAWDLCRICGAKEIYIAGMDLGFPRKETHVRGSQFEERIHRLSSRFHTAEQDSIQSLMGANPEIQKDYNGNPLLTDKRMSLFSWWFESNCTQSNTEGLFTYTLTEESLAIPGIKAKPVEALLAQKDIESSRKEFFARAEEKSTKSSANPEEFTKVLDDFNKSLDLLQELSESGLELCKKAIKNPNRVKEVSIELTKIDSLILNSKAKNAAALVFPTERQLKKLAQNIPQDPVLNSIYMSRLIYTELSHAISEYKTALKIY